MVFALSSGLVTNKAGRKTILIIGIAGCFMALAPMTVFSAI
jgi:hypothetical protein